MKKQRLISMLLSAALTVSALPAVYVPALADSAYNPGEGVTEVTLTSGTDTDSWSGITAENGVESNKYLHIENVSSNTGSVWIYANTTVGTEYVLELKLRNNAKIDENYPMEYRLLKDGAHLGYYTYDGGDEQGWMTITQTFTASSGKTAFRLRGSDRTHYTCIPFDIDDLTVYAADDADKSNVLYDDTGLWITGTANAYDFEHLEDGDYTNNWNLRGRILDFDTNELLLVKSESYFATADDEIDNTVVAEYTAAMTLQPGEYTLSGKFRVSDVYSNRLLVACDEAANKAFLPDVTPYRLLADYNKFNLNMVVYSGENVISSSADAVVTGEFAAVSHTFTLAEATDVTKIAFVGSDGIDLIPDTIQSWPDGKQHELWYTAPFGMCMLKTYPSVPTDTNAPYLYTYSDLTGDHSLVEAALAGKTAPAAIPFDMDDVSLTTEDGLIGPASGETDSDDDGVLFDGNVTGEWSGLSKRKGKRSNSFLRFSEVIKSTDGFQLTVDTPSYEAGGKYTVEFKLRTNANTDSSIQYRIICRDTTNWAIAANKYITYTYNASDAGWMNVGPITFTATGPETEIYFRGSDAVANACVPFEIDDITVYEGDAVSDNSAVTNIITGTAGVCGLDDGKVPECIVGYGYAVASVENETYYATANAEKNGGITARYTSDIVLEPGKYTISGKFRVSDVLTKRIVCVPDYWQPVDAVDLDQLMLERYLDYNRINLSVTLFVFANGESSQIKASPVGDPTVTGEWATLSFTFSVPEETTVKSLTFTGADGVDIVPSTDDPSLTPGDSDILYVGTDAKGYTYDVCVAKVVDGGGHLYRHYEFHTLYKSLLGNMLADKTVPAVIPFDIDDVKLTFDGQLKKEKGEVNFGIFMVLLKKMAGGASEEKQTVFDDGVFNVGEVLTLTSGVGKNKWSGITVGNGDKSNAYLRVSDILCNNSGISIAVPTTPGTEYKLEFDFRNNSATDRTMQYRMIANDSNGTRIAQAYFDYRYSSDNGGKMAVTPFTFTATTSKTSLILCGSDYIPASCVPFDVDNVTVYASSDKNKVNVLTTEGTPYTFDEKFVPGWIESRDASGTSLKVIEETYYATATKSSKDSVSAIYTAGYELEPGQYEIKGDFRVSDVNPDRMVAIYSWGPHGTVIDDWNTYNKYRDYNNLKLGIKLKGGNGEIIAASEDTSFASEWKNLTYTFEITEPTKISDIYFTADGGMKPVPNTADANMSGVERNLWYGNNFGICILKCGNDDGTMMNYDTIKEWKSGLYDEIMEGKTVPASIPFDMDNVQLTRLK